MRIRAYLLVLLLSVLILFAGCDFLLDMFPDSEQSSGVDSDNDNNTLLGLPSSAASGTQLIEHESYTVLFSYDDLIPIWVSWHLDADDSGKCERKDNFSPDPAITIDEYKVTDGDYNKCGFSRGHLCPNADRDGNEKLQDQTFYMTNMVPQNQSLNGGDWSALEEYCRELASKDFELYIIAGSIIGDEGGLRSDGKGRVKEFTSSSGKTITVPSQLWKAFIVITQDDSVDDLERIIEGETKVYGAGVIMDNEPFNGTWKDAIVPIDEIESITGLNLFSALPDNIENSIESAVKGILPPVA